MTIPEATANHMPVRTGSSAGLSCSDATSRASAFPGREGSTRCGVTSPLPDFICGYRLRRFG
jgi:hypothetical protein